jgi:hypothetical protein
MLPQPTQTGEKDFEKTGLSSGLGSVLAIGLGTSLFENL